jgi:hypothetical protein
LRVKRDVGRQHNVGFFATTYTFPERHNNTAGFDGRFRLNPKTVAEFQIVGTHSRRFFYDSDLTATSTARATALVMRIQSTALTAT